MVAGPGDETAAGTGTGDRGYLRASHADREQAIGVLKTAFVQGLLPKDEFEARVGQAFVSRTYAELAMVTVGLPLAQPSTQPSAQPPAAAQGEDWLTMKRAVTWSACMVIPTAIATVISGLFANNADAFSVLFVPLLGFFVATVVAYALIGGAWEKRRSRAQSPRGPAPVIDGQVSRGTGSATGPGGQRQADRGQQDVAEASRSGLPAPVAWRAATA